MATSAEDSFIFRNFVEPLIKDLGLASFSEAVKEQAVEKKEEKKVAKPTTQQKKNDKGPAASTKTVAREGDNSLLLNQNPSVFTVFYRMRNLLLQEQLVGRFNNRLVAEGGETGEGEEEEGQGWEDDELEGVEISKMVSLGIKGLFEMVKETWRSHPELCKKALQSFFELLQGLDPETLEQEPEEVIDALNHLLLDMVNEQVTVDNQTANEIASLAVSCLVALVLGRGEPHRMLCAISTIITGEEGLVDQKLQIPENMNTLQRVVQATLLNSTPSVDWYGDGVMTSFQTDRFTAKGATNESSGPSAVASDGRFLYILTGACLRKVGTGYGGTVQGHVYKENTDFMADEPDGWLGFAAGKLYHSSRMPGEDVLSVLDPDTLVVEGTVQLDSDSLGPHALLSFGNHLAQILARKDGSFSYRELDTAASPLVCVRERQLDFQQKGIITHGSSEVLGGATAKQSLKLPSPTDEGGAAAVKDTKVCESGAHTFTESATEHPCRVCTLCGHCTGYGPNCVSTKGTRDRVSGSPCGCGSGCPGCLTCGVCLVCAGVDVPAGHTLQEFYLSKNEGEAKKTYEAGRERIKKLKDSTKKKKGGKKVKVAVEEKAVQLDDSSSQVQQMIVQNKFAVVCTRDGKVRYTGSKVPFGQEGETKPGEWLTVELPQEQKASVVACTATTAFFLTAEGTVFTSGLNLKGEMGMKASSSSKPNSLRKHTVLQEQKIASIGAHGQTFAAVNTEGSLFLIGKTFKGLADKDTGVVTSLLGTTLTQVALGNSHVAVLTDMGKLITFGQNRHGQCGRNYVPIPEKETEEEEASEEEEEPVVIPSAMDKCKDKKHSYAQNTCMICTVCGYCTGYGPSCCNTHNADRVPGTECGCGSGESGCTNCGACQVCTGDGLSDQHTLMVYISSADVDIVELYERGREQVRKEKEAEERKQSEGKPKEKKKKKKDAEGVDTQPIVGSNMGINSLFVFGSTPGGTVGSTSGGTVGSEDEGAVSRQTSVEIPPESKTDTPAEVVIGEDTLVMQVACGLLHTVVMTVEGEVWCFGGNQHGQCGQGHTNNCGEPVKVPLPGPASQIACGDYHTVVLLATGEVMTFGQYTDGQLGRSDEGEEDSDSWNLSPDYALKISAETGEKTAMYISANGNLTVMVVSESLLTERSISCTTVFGNDKVVGVLSPQKPREVVMVDTHEGKLQRLKDQAELKGHAVCMDPEYTVVWSFSSESGEVTCFNPVAAGVESTFGSILSPSLTIPCRRGSSITRGEAALNLLSCLCTLAKGKTLDEDLLVARTEKSPRNKPSLSFKEVKRFPGKVGGTWGYDDSSVDAIRFSIDKDIILGGAGIYANTSPATFSLHLYDAGDTDSDPGDKAKLLQEVTATDVKVVKREDIFPIHLKTPVHLKAGHRYVLAVKGSGRKETPSGKGGQAKVTVDDDKVTFSFYRAKLSNNGTDMSGGQLPSLFYCLGTEKDVLASRTSKEKESPEVSEDYLVGISKRFSLKVTQDGLGSLLHLLNWSWKRLHDQRTTSVWEVAVSTLSLSKLKDTNMVTFITVACLDLLKTYITRVYPDTGKPAKSPGDTPEMAQSVYHSYLLIKRILSDPSAVKIVNEGEGKDPHYAAFKEVMAAAQATYVACFHAFYPTSALKWLELCSLLCIVDPLDVVTGSAVPQLLCCVLEILTRPSMGYIGLAYSSAASLKSATLSSEEECRYPALSELMQAKALEDRGEVSLLSFQDVADKLLRLVAAPIQMSLAGKEVLGSASSVISLAGKLLVSRIQELALWNTFPEALQQLSSGLGKKIDMDETPARFTDTIEVSKVDQPKLMFKVNQLVVLRGLSVHGGGASTREVSLTIKQGDDKLFSKKQTVKFSKKTKKLHRFNLKHPLALQPEETYTIELQMDGGSYVVGTGSKTTLEGPKGVTFTLLKSPDGKVDPENGPIVALVYSLSDSSLNPLEMYLSVVQSILTITTSYLERALSEGLPSDLMEALSSSFLCATLLPMSLAQLGPIMCRDTKYAIAALDMVRGVLPLVSQMNKVALPTSPDDLSHGVHVANLETDHPYPQATVLHYKVEFPKDVKWMTLEIDPQTQFAQKWDSLSSIMVPKPTEGTDTQADSGDRLPYVVVSREDIHYKYGSGQLALAAKYPKGVILLPGNELHIEVHTDTEYDKKEDASHFGLKCQVMGFEWSASCARSLAILEKELVTLSGMCCGKLLKECSLPWHKILKASEKDTTADKADMRIVEAAAKKVLAEHSQILHHGLQVEMPSIQETLAGDLQDSTPNQDLQFLTSFIEDKEGTPASRLARWLQPERSVDMNSIDIQIPEGEHQLGKDISVNIIIKDLTGTVVAVPDMQVELLATFIKTSGQEDGAVRTVNPNTGVSPPEFTHKYTAITQGNMKLNAMSAMMPYSDYSFEELRLYAPLNEGESTSVGVSVNKDGSYTGTWVPLKAGQYQLQLRLDGKETGTNKELSITPPTLAKEEEDKKAESLAEEGQKTQFEMVTIKRKKARLGKYSGLRIRAEPSLKADMIGLLKPGDAVAYTEEVQNEDGAWIQVPRDQVQKYRVPAGGSHDKGFALIYHAGKEDEKLLDETDPLEQMKQLGAPTALSWKRKRKGGAGTYVVLQCGSAGHNIRSKPSLQGTPVGRLKLGDTFQVENEKETEDGIWLKLTKDSRQKLCKSQVEEAWALALAPSGRLFLHIEDPSLVKPAAAANHSEAPKKLTSEPSAAERLFGTPKTDKTPQAPVASPPNQLSLTPQLEFATTSEEKIPFFLGAEKQEEKEKTEGEDQEKEKEEKDQEGEEKEKGEVKQADKSSLKFTLGVGDPPAKGKGKKHREKSPISPRKKMPPVLRSLSPLSGLQKEEPNFKKYAHDNSQIAPSEKTLPALQPSDPLSVPRVEPSAKALSPAVAECQRAVFAAFLWHEGLVPDAAASATFLKFHPELVKEHGRDPEEKTEGEADKATHSLPPTLNYLVTLWEELAVKVTDAATATLKPSFRMEEIIQDLQARYDAFKKQEDARKTILKKASGNSHASGSGRTTCEMCDETFPDPVTYHMKEAHPGCRKHASGWGYNSRGGYCSGWAGNCGDGGSGGSTWYLMCKACHEKYLKEKESKAKELISQAATIQHMTVEKVQPPGKPRELAVIPTVQAMLHRARFLLTVGSTAESRPKTLPLKTQDAYSRQVSSPGSTGKESEGVGIQVKVIAAESPEPTNFDLGSKPPSFQRSQSMMPAESTDGPHGSKGSVKRQATYESAAALQDQPGLLAKPSIALKRLIYSRSVKDPKGVTASYNRILKFVTSSFDLEGLEATMKQLMRIASIKSHTLKFLHWLLDTTADYGTVHVILWHFVSSLSDDPVEALEAELMKDKEKKEGEKDQSEVVLYHPLKGLEGAGAALTRLRDEFHSYLKAVSDQIMKLPMGSLAQQMAMRNWFLHFQGADHAFLVHSNIFNNVSAVLANVEEPESAKKKEFREGKECKVFLYSDLVSQGTLKVSSNQAMLNSLTDASTETFWESSGESRGNFKRIDLTFEEDVNPSAVAVHIDNTKDTGQRVDTLVLSFGDSLGSLKKRPEVKLLHSHSGWKLLHFPLDTKCKAVRVELKGTNQNVRVRQIKLLTPPPSSNSDAVVPVEVAHMQSCEQEALKLFRLLTSQVFGGLVVPERVVEEEDGKAEKEEGTEPSTPEPKSGLYGNMADVLFGKGKLTGLQKQTGEHLIQSVHSETQRMEREYWDAIEEFISPPKPTEGEEVAKISSDTYCFELMSMIIGLCRSEPGCQFLASSDCLVQDLFTLLHVASMRVQLQVVTLLQRLYPVIEPERMAKVLDVPGLPPIGYSAFAEATSTISGPHRPQLGILDCLLACISKALSVQVRAKGMLSNMLTAITKAAGSAVSIQSLSVTKKGVTREVPMETTVAPKRRWLTAGSMPVEVAMEVIKLIREMIEGKLGSRWKDIATAAVGQAVLHLTKVSEGARVPQPGIFSQTLWLCLGALCVINQEHATTLSAGELVGQSDGKTKEKPVCENHDDGVTPALVQCEDCGNLCGECDRILHLRKKMKSHQRKVFKEEEEAVKVDLHENSGRVKLYWIVALADSKTLKGMVEFRETGSGAGGQCRFCGSSSGTSLMTVGTICNESECQERAGQVCEKTLSCGHQCCGVKGEEECLPCLHGCSPPTGADTSNWDKLKQDADDMCMICYTEALSCAPSIQLACGHVFHSHCCRNSLTVRWSGPRIAFRFMFCSLCEVVPIAHPSLQDVLDPVLELYEDVKRKALLRLEYENLTKCEAITAPTSKYYQKPAEYAINRYAYYVCYKCNKAYYGGEAVCAEAASDDYDPKELVCGGCSDVTAAQVCPKHGTDFLEYKCRYCCSVAVFFCFGTTHFCTACHDDFSRLTSMPKADLPQCPVGPRAKPLEGEECPLHVKHPPTGDEFALGCGVCRNAQTF